MSKTVHEKDYHFDHDAPPEQQAAVTELVVGDQIEVINPASMLCGHRGHIVEIAQTRRTSPLHYWVRMDTAPGRFAGKTFTWVRADIQPVKEPIPESAPDFLSR